MHDKFGEIICDVCGKNGARKIHVTKNYGKEGSLLVIENVPVVSCPCCSESCLTAKTLREIDNIKRNRANVAVERAVPAAVFV
ncbi:MAG: YgiT-type zinc finger protein [Pyrinomonadaceae bacterium]